MSRVLVVEDDPALSLLLQRIFGLSGLAVTMAANGEDALSIIDATDPDVIVTDLNMPRCDGLELCRRLRMDARYETTPILVYTAVAAEDPRVEEIQKIPNVTVMTKPVAARVLATQVHQMLDGAVLKGSARVRELLQ